MFKAMPRGALYTKIFAHANGTSCLSRGYAHADGEDQCYPGLRRFFKKKNDRSDFEESERRTLQLFGLRYHLPKRTVSLMDTCTCHVNSAKRLPIAESCTDLDNMPGAWVHRNPWSGKELVCLWGPFEQATRALAVLKSTMQLPMHLEDQIIPMECNALGFKYKDPLPDHCFNLDMHTKTWPPESDDCGKESMKIEIALGTGGFEKFVDDNGLDGTILNSIVGCHCSPTTKIYAKRFDECALPHSSSPIRDWWKE